MRYQLYRYFNNRIYRNKKKKTIHKIYRRFELRYRPEDGKGKKVRKYFNSSYKLNLFLKSFKDAEKVDRFQRRWRLRAPAVMGLL